MTTVPQIARRRSYKRYLGRKSISGGIAIGCSLLISLFLLLAGMVVSYYYVILTSDLPSLDLFSLYLDPPDGLLLQPTVLYDRTGKNELLKLINPAATDGRYLFVNRSISEGVEFFSKDLIRATIYNLEPDFWNTQGSPLGWLFNESEYVLAQRFVSEVVLWDEPQGVLHDLRIRLLASQVVEEFGREKVLEWYLNNAKFGNYVYGADAAAHVYLGKSASEVNLAEGLLITVIAEAPDINPHTVPELVRERYISLIQRTLDQGLISRKEARSAIEESFIFREEIELEDNFQPYTHFALEQITSILPTEQIERGGMRIITSMDYELQIQTHCAMHASVLQFESMSRDVSTIDGSPCQAARLLPTVFTSGEELPEKLRATTAITDPGTGQLLAFVMVSNTNHNPSLIDKFPAGTVLTPYVYLTAFTRGSNPGTMVWDIPEEVDLSSNETFNSGIFELINYNEPYHGPIRLRTALANDYLRPTLKLLDQMGFENILATLSRFGLNYQNSINDKDDLLDLLFEEDIRFLDVVRGYGILANQGVIAGQVMGNESQVNDFRAVEISGVLRLEDASGNLLKDFSSPRSKPIVSPQLAYLISHILSDERIRWESMGHPNPLEIGQPIAVKLSRTLDEKGSWVVGYNTERVVGIWIESLESDEQALLPELNSGLWHAITQYALGEEPVTDWKVPPGITMVEVCDPSGLLPTSNCPNVVTEVYLSGQEPLYFDNLYRSFQINRETGNLATVFTPPELLEEHVYLVVPPQADEWANSMGVPLAPKNYDTVGVPSNPSSHVSIDFPQMFSQVRGKVQIRGSASGNEFSYYRIQVGQGLNPQKWIQIGDDFPQPVDDNLLVTWDTNGLSGLWMIQLLVVHQDQRIERAVQQVTIDNEPPFLNILSPEDNKSFKADESELLVLRVDVIDDLEIAKVEFYLDDHLLATLTLPPYVASWKSIIGEHTLLVKAQDLAGNVSQDSIKFIVSK